MKSHIMKELFMDFKFVLQQDHLIFSFHDLLNIPITVRSISWACVFRNVWPSKQTLFLNFHNMKIICILFF